MQNLEYKERLEILKLPTLVYRRLRGDMIETYKITSGLYDEEIGNMFLMYRDVVGREGLRGHNKKIYKFKSTCKPRQTFFTQRVVEIWNNLPSKVVNAPTVKSFENRLDKIWHNQDILYNFEALIKKETNRAEKEENKDLDIED